MSDNTDLNDRIVRLEERQKMLRQGIEVDRTKWAVDIAEIKTKLDMLLEREYQRQGAVTLTRSLIAALGLIAGAIGGWLGHFWWGK